MATPTAAGMSGKKISNAGSGLATRIETTKMTGAATAAVYMNHFSCCRSTGPDRRNLTTRETAPASRTKTWAVVSRL